MKRRPVQSITRRLNNIIVIAACITMIIVSFPVIIVFSAIIKNSAIDDKKQLMHEIMNQVDIKVDSIAGEARRIQLDNQLGVLLQRFYQGEDVRNDINLRLNTLIAPVGNVYRNVLLVIDDGEIFDSITRISEADLNMLDLVENHQDDEFYISSPFEYIDGFGLSQTGLGCITTFTSLQGISGRLIINMDFSFFESTFRSIEKQVDRYFWIGFDDRPVFPVDADTSGFDLARVYKLAGSTNLYYEDVFDDRGVSNILIYSRVSPLALVAQASRVKLLEQYNWFIFYYVLSIALLVIVILVTVLPMMRRQLRPLRDLSAMMKELSTGNLDLVSDIRTNDEIEELSNAFNTMTEKLKYYIEMTVENEKDKERMRYSLLISQVNPHFIYNTLNTITYLVRQKRSGDIIAVNSALIKILRDTLRVDAVQIFDSVEQEVEVVEQYLIIQRYRYSSPFDLIWQIDDEALKLAIPKNLIQPLVENALFHGLLPCEDPAFHGRINVTVSLSGKHIILQVSDNGIGMDTDSLAEARRWIEHGAEIRGRHIGLKNIIGRVAHLYGSLEGQSRLQIESAPNGGTTVTIVLDKEKSDPQAEDVFRFE